MKGKCATETTRMKKKSNMGGPRWALAPIVLTLCYQRCTHTTQLLPLRRVVCEEYRLALSRKT